MATTIMDSSGNNKMTNYRNRQVFYWIAGAVVLMSVLFYFLSRPQNTNRAGMFPQNSSTGTNQNTNEAPTTNMQRDGTTNR